MSDPVRLALIGAGGIGARHLGLAGEEPGCEIVAVADPAEAAAEVAGSHGARFYRGYRELLDRERLDGAIVATPNDSHARVGIACAERSAGCRCWWKSRLPTPSNRAAPSWTRPRRMASGRGGSTDAFGSGGNCRISTLDVDETVPLCWHCRRGNSRWPTLEHSSIQARPGKPKGWFAILDSCSWGSRRRGARSAAPTRRGGAGTGQVPRPDGLRLPGSGGRRERRGDLLGEDAADAAPLRERKGNRAAHGIHTRTQAHFLARSPSGLRLNGARAFTEHRTTEVPKWP